MKAIEILYAELKDINESIRNLPYLSNNKNHLEENKKYVEEAIAELEALENRSCDNCKNASFEIKFGELEFNACFLVSNGNVCKWELK